MMNKIKILEKNETAIIAEVTADELKSIEGYTVVTTVPSRKKFMIFINLKSHCIMAFN